jgi:hypothetical protein
MITDDRKTIVCKEWFELVDIELILIVSELLHLGEKQLSERFFP